MKTELHAIRGAVFAAACLLAPYACAATRLQGKLPATDDAERVYSQSEVDKKAVIDNKSRANNFPSAEGCQGHGSALLRAVLHKSGKVTDAVIRRESGCKKFDERAIKATLKVKFKPAIKDGVAVSQYAMFEYNYTVW